MQAFKTQRAAVAATLLFTLNVPSARAAPTDPYQAAANGTALPKNEAKALERPGPDGSFSYDLPIAVPPGHQGLAPALRLHYSSSGALRGGVAVGWSLPLPEVEQDFAIGDRVVYSADLGGGPSQLTRVVDGSLQGEQYRAIDDAEQARFEHFTYAPPALSSWVASTPAGRRVEFIETSSAPYPAHRWRVQRESDADGNRIDYQWTPETLGGYSEQVLSAIEYGANPAAGVVAHAKVEFQYAPMEACAGGLVPTGAMIDQRGSLGEMHGARRLKTIVTSVRDTPTGAWRVVRRVTLTYDGYELSCSTSHAPLRYLTSVGETAYTPAGVATALPNKTFAYGPDSPTFAEVRDLGVAPDGGMDAGWRRGATQMVRDLDGDALPDLVRVDTDATGCILHTHRGVYGGGFAAADLVTPLPSLDWAVPGQPNDQEICTLGGQFAERPGTGSIYACAVNLANVSYNFVDWDGDGVVDLLTNVWMSNWTDQIPGGDFTPLFLGSDSPPPSPTDAQKAECGESGGSLEGNRCTCPSGTSAEPSAPAGNRCQPTCEPGLGAGCTQPGEHGPSQGDPGGSGPGGPVCSWTLPTPEPGFGDNLTTWRVFAGTGAGAFSSDSLNIEAPLGLDTGRPETAIVEQLTRPDVPRLLDVDGDGRPDLVSQPIDANGQPWVANQAFGDYTTLTVWRNLDSAGLAPPASWPVPVYAQLKAQAAYGPLTTGTLSEHFANTRELATVDWNGDGRTDVVGNNVSNLVVSWNHGAGFGVPALINGTGPLESWAADLPDLLTNNPYEVGARIATRQLLDVDADGLPDLLDTTPATNDVSTMATIQVRVNLGGWLGPAIPGSVALWFANQRLNAVDGLWEHDHNALDVTGDGVLDLVEYASDGHLRARTEPVNQPLRLMRSINSGQGALTRIDYVPSTDPTVVDRAGLALPFVRWVVRGITVDPGAGQPPLVSQFSYAQPVWSITTAPHDARAFLGFAKMTTDTATTAALAEKARTVATFANVGGNLRPSSEWTYGTLGAGWTPLRHTAHTWIAAPLYDGAARFTYQSELVEHHCALGATEASCVADLAGTHARASQYDAVLGTDGRPRAYLHAREASVIDASHARLDVTQYRVDQSYAHYQIVPTSTETDASQIVTTIFGSTNIVTPMARTRFELDTAGHALRTWVSTADGVELLTVRTFDLAGNAVTVRKPSQAGLVTTTAYDPFLLTAISTTNERGQVVKTQYDLGTGVLVRREGPSSRTYAPCAGCGNVTAFAPETWALDGFGRVLSHAVAADPTSGGGYTTVVVDEHVYDDVALPTKVTHRTKVDWAGTLIGSTEERTDGLGRLLTRIAPGTVTVNNTTSYRYDAAGNLLAVDSQDPRRDTMAMVTTSYLYDALGRTTRMTRPDASMVSTSYDHDDTLVTESSPADGTGARTRYLHDRAGRIVTVDQYDLPAAGQHALTQTTYDALDRPLTIVDADGITTSLTHDWAGRRTAVTRGLRTWRFGYDADGNLTSRTAPLPTVMSDPELYTSRWSYDVLGRLATHTVATRGMNAARMTQLGLGTTSYLYDTAANGVGLPARVTWPSGRVDYTYDVHGLPATEARQLTMPTASGTVTPSQSVTRTYAVDGQLATEKWDDNSQWSVTFDTRGLPSKSGWLDPVANRWMAVSNTSRGVVGVPRARDGATYDQRRTWMYDALGRVIYDRVYKVSTNGTWSERNYGYDGLGELRGIAGTVDGQLADTTFTYDAGHRLVDAAGPANYTAHFTYTGGGNVTRATIVGGDTGTRDVRYQYGARDPQAADALVDATTGAQRASWTYDLSGNAVQRVTAGGTYNQTWDGDDAMREVVGPAGTERYYYDHTGARIGAVGPDGVKFWFGSNETRFTAAGVQTTRWLHLTCGDVVGRVENKNNLELQYADALQNLILTTSSGGAVTGSFVYGAFGEVVASRGAATHRRQFNGKENDLATGLRYYGARYYDPLLLRWTSADPLYRAVPDMATLEPQRGNWYAFSLNNPVRYYDPDGRDADDLGGQAIISQDPGTTGRWSVMVAQGTTTRFNVGYSMRGTKVYADVNIQVRADGAIDITDQGFSAHGDDLITGKVVTGGQTVTISSTRFETHSKEANASGMSATPAGPGVTLSKTTTTEPTGGFRTTTDNFTIVPVPPATYDAIHASAHIAGSFYAAYLQTKYKERKQEEEKERRRAAAEDPDGRRPDGGTPSTQD